MRKYIFLLILIVFTSCKTTPKDYSNYTFIGEDIKSDKYELVTLVPEHYELKNMLGYTLTNGMFSPELEKKTWDMPLIYFNKKNTVFYIVYDRNKSAIHYMKYDFLSNKKDTIKNEDSIKIYNQIFEKNYEKSSDLVDFKFPGAEKYYTVLNKEYHSEISEEKKKQTLEKYKDYSEEIKQDMIKTESLRYNTVYAELQMPEEKIQFKFNSNVKKKIEFFGNEELYKKGYIYIYIYNNLNMFSHSGGLYVIKPKEKH